LVRDDGDVVATIAGLTVDFRDGAGWSNVLDRVDLLIPAGASLGLVGESGCGKTTTAYSLLGYRRPGSRIREGSVRVLGRELLSANWRDLERVRGGQIGFVPQNPTTALNPRLRVGTQIDETLRCHRVGGSSAARKTRIHELIDRVGLSGAERVARAYPHQLSGGQQQRIMIALALACSPRLVVLDEPTTGLDVTTQAQILELLTDLRAELGMSLLYVTHDLGVIAEVCDRVCVMYAGHVVEEAPVREIFENPRHPYTRGLIAAVPSLHGAWAGGPKPLKGLLHRHSLPAGCRFAPRCEYSTPRCFGERQSLEVVGPSHQVACWRVDVIPASIAPVFADELVPAGKRGETLLRVSDLDCSYDVRNGWLSSKHAPSLVVSDVSFEVRQGETLALVGESGSGKSTIARSIAGILPPVSGSLQFGELTVPWAVRERSSDVLRSIQLILQNPDASLNPRRHIDQIIGRPLEFYFGLHGERRTSRVMQLLDDVRLDRRFAGRFPAELSGGERQRVAIARALAAEPTLVLCDEILSALDVSVQAEILDLMHVLQQRDGMAYLFISHDLNVVHSIAQHVAVLYHGELCEVGLTAEVFEPPFHPYTNILLASVPGEASAGHRRRPTLGRGAVTAQRSGCPLAAGCPQKIGAICEQTAPPWQQISSTHAIRCHIPIHELREAGRRPTTAPVAVNGGEHEPL
jgi:peptide/nickel transport system ATP-binding protein